MASFLDKQLQKAIAKGFKGQLLKGMLIRQGSEEVDERGNLVPGPEMRFAFEGFTDTFSAYTRAQVGIPMTDAKIVIIAGSLSPFTYPQKEDRVLLRGKTWRIVERMETDPAEAVFDVWATEIKS